MSAPNPEKWRATETMVHGATGAGKSQNCVAAVISLCDSVARRRAIAELRVIADAWGPNCQEGAELERRIAEIEAEQW